MPGTGVVDVHLAFDHLRLAHAAAVFVEFDRVDDLVLLGDFHSRSADRDSSQADGKDDFAVEPDPLHDLAKWIVVCQRLDGHPNATRSGDLA
jgi:hypothetical protein